MLQQLYIKNYAIIEEIDLSFDNGFSVITGETGAGKSILIGALGLLLGERADPKVLLNPNEKAIIEARFDISKNEWVKNYLDQGDFDVAEHLILRREITPQGKSRAFINDTPCKLNDLKNVRLELVDLHRQFDTLELQSEQMQFQYLDSFAQTQSLLKTYQESFKQYKHIESELQASTQQFQNDVKERDYLNFIFQEIEELQLKENEIESLTEDVQLLENAHEIKSQLVQITQEISLSDTSVIERLRQANKQLSNQVKHFPALEELNNRLHSTLEELKDIASELEGIEEKTEVNPEKLEQASLRLNEANRLLQKHRTSSTQELLTFKNELSDKLNGLEISNQRINEWKAELEQMETSLIQQAKILREKRKTASLALAKEIQANLSELGMPEARIKIQLEDSALNFYGADQLQFLFDANRTDVFAPIHKVASGGELSRLMLSIKYIIAKKTYMPCMIFDEIDTGISGDVAKKVASKLATLSDMHQLICISHLPQIAAKATHHLFAFKQKGQNSFTTSSVKKLNHEERIESLAIMLSGNNPSETALAAAKELMLID